MADNQENGDVNDVTEDALLQGDPEEVGLTDLDADNQFEGGDGDATTTQEENAVEDPVCFVHFELKDLKKTIFLN